MLYETKSVNDSVCVVLKDTNYTPYSISLQEYFVKTVNVGDKNSIIVPLNIYFKLNSLDNSQAGLNYQYIDLNNSTRTVKHVKKIKFFLENEAENRPFIFTLKFNLNRNKVIVRKFNSTGGSPAYIDDWSTSSKK